MAGMQETDHLTLKNGITYLLQDSKARAKLADLLAEVMEKYGANNPPPYPVTSVNGQTGDVQIQTGGAVDSVNGKTGDVELDAEDVGALPNTTQIPSKTSDLTNDSGFVNAAGAAAAAPVQSVNGQTGDVTVQGGSGSGIAIQDDEPTDGELVWIDTDDSGTTHIIPEIDDTQESAVDTWSSQKIAEEFAGVLPLGEVATNIPANADLNDYDLPGVYAIRNNAIAVTLVNSPSVLAGVLRIFSSGGGNISASSTWKYLLQEYITYRGARYQRYGESGSGTAVTWGAWETIHPITLAALNGVSQNAVTLSNGDDLDNYHTSGFYYIRTGVTNAPASWCWCIICDGAGTMQMCITSTNIFVRCYTGNPLAWTRWRSVALS